MEKSDYLTMWTKLSKKPNFNYKDVHIFGETNSVYITNDPDSDWKIISVRGTDEIGDWLGTNLRILHRSYGNIPDACVHTGFYDVYKKLKTTVLEGDWGDKIVFAGHSMGGPVSSILALEYKLIYPEKDIKIYTAGSPKAGNTQFNNWLCDIVGSNNIFHRRNIVDILQFLPIGCGYEALPGKNMWFFEPLFPHRVKTYVDASQEFHIFN